MPKRSTRFMNGVNRGSCIGVDNRVGYQKRTGVHDNPFGRDKTGVAGAMNPYGTLMPSSERACVASKPYIQLDIVP